MKDKDLVFKCVGDLEQGYGFCVMVDQLVDAGLGLKTAIKIASNWLKMSYTETYLSN